MRGRSARSKRAEVDAADADTVGDYTEKLVGSLLGSRSQRRTLRGSDDDDGSSW